ncbi:hypothetical protein [Pedobacter sp. NJ-S-72]
MAFSLSIDHITKTPYAIPGMTLMLLKKSNLMLSLNLKDREENPAQITV